MNEKAEALRRRMSKPWTFKLFLMAKLPLGACAGLGLDALDDRICRVSLPGGWRTQNPFRSTYFAAQFMAAEMATGAPAFVLADASSASISMLLLSVKGDFQKRIQGRSTFTFEDVAGIGAAMERAATTGEGVTYTGAVTACGPDGQVASTFAITWSFKRRS